MRRRSSTRLGFAAALGAVAACIFSPLATPASYTIVAGGAPVTVSVTTSGGTSTASFSGTAGQRISLNMSSVTITSSHVSILKPGGTLVAPFTVTKTGRFLEVKTLPATGTYKILVDPKLTYTGHMVLTLYDVPADPTASIATDGTPSTVTTTTPGQNAKLTFSGTAGQRVSVNLTGVSYSSAKLRIYNPDSTLLYPTALAFGTGGGFLEPKLLLATGVYTLQVDPQFLAKGSATARLYIVPADPTNAITPCAAQPCAPTPASTGTPGQNAYFTFTTVTPNQRVSLLFSNSTYGSLKASILKPDGSALYSPPTTVTSLDTFVDTKPLATVGQYKIFIDPQYAYMGGVDATVFSVPTDAGGAITAGTPVTATTTMPGQNALYTYSGTAGQRISLDLSNVTYVSAKVSVLKPDGIALFPALTVTSLGKFVEPTKLLTTGTYTVKIDPAGIATGSTDVKLSVVPADVTGALAPGVLKTVSIGTPGQNAVLTYAGTNGQRIALNLTNAATLGASACCSAKVKITKPDGTYLQLPVSFGTDGKFIDVKALTVTGTYKVTIDPQTNATGSVDVTLYLVPPDSTGALANGVGAVVTTTAPGQNAWRTFSGTNTQRISLKVSAFTMTGPASPNVRIKILKPDGSTFESFFFPVTGDDFLEPKTLPSNGTYKIVVDPQDVTTGSLTLTYYVVPPNLTGTLGASTAVPLTTPGQNAVYTFAGNSGQTVTITESAGATISLARVELKSPTGSTVDVGYWDASGGSFTASLPSTGTYTVEVDPQGSASGSLTLGLS